MTQMDNSTKGNNPQAADTATEGDFTELMLEAFEQYEAFVELAKLSGSLDTTEVCYPSYRWDNPIGLVVN